MVLSRQQTTEGVLNIPETPPSAVPTDGVGDEEMKSLSNTPQTARFRPDPEASDAHQESTDMLVVAMPADGAPPNATAGDGGQHADEEAEEEDYDTSSELSLTESELRAKEELQQLKDALKNETDPKKRMLLQMWYFFRNKFVERRWFQWSNILIIVANMAILCAHHYGMDEDTEKAFDVCNLAFTIYFTVEALIRFLAEPPNTFIRNFFNVFDVLIVVMSWIDLGVDQLDLPAIRAFRILRIVKLLKVFPNFYQWILFIIAAAKASPILVLMLLLEMFIFSVISMQLFGGRLCGMADGEPDTIARFPAAVPTVNLTNDLSGVVPNCTGTVPCNSSLLTNTTGPITVLEPEFYEVFLPSTYDGSTCKGLPRTHFDNFYDAMITSFVILTADDWNFIMYDCMKARGPWVAIAFLVFFYMGNYVLLNLFIAILLSANAKEATEEDLERELEEEKKQQEAQAAFEALERQEEEKEQERLKLLYGGDDEDDQSVVSSEASEAGDRNANRTYFVDKRGRVHNKSSVGKFLDWVFRSWDGSRKYVRAMVEHIIFQGIMGVIIIFSSVCMGLEDPIAAPDTPLIKTLFTIDIIVTIVYVIEVLLYWHSYGLVRRRTSYLRRDRWNVLDFMLVLISIIGVSVNNLRDNVFIRTIKVLRALRPLRLVKRSPGMRLVLSAVAGSLSNLRNVVVMATGIFTIWGVAGVFLFGGKLRKCYVGDVPHFELSEDDCTRAGGFWINDDQNFDNLAWAMLMLFQVATLEGWAGQMYRTMDARELGLPPKRDANPITGSTYFMFAAAFAGLFLMNLFISVLIEAYNTEKRKASLQRSLLLTREQEAWVLTNKRIARFLPLDEADEDEDVGPKSFDEMTFKEKSVVMLKRSRNLTRKMVHSSKFVNFYLLMIFFNFMTMAIEHYPQEAIIGEIVDTSNIVFTALFALEAALKIFGETWRVYISSKWNRLDLLVAIVGIASVSMQNYYNTRNVALIRSLRVIRLARLTRGYFAIDRMIGNIGFALMSLGHVFAAIVLTFFIFSIMGMRLFGRVKRGIFGDTNGIDKHTNFERLDSSMFLLTRVTTGGDWVTIMQSCSVEAPFCDPQLGECGPAIPVAQIFFVMFCMTSMFLLKNLLTAVLLDGFSSSGSNRAISKKDAQFFYRSWKHFDPRETLTISPFDTLPFIRSLHKTCVLGFNSKPKRKRLAMEFQFLMQLQLGSLRKRTSIVNVVDTLNKMAFLVPPPENWSFANEREAQRNVFRSFLAIGSPLTDGLKTVKKKLTKENLARFGNSVGRGFKSVGSTLEQSLMSPEKREKMERREQRRREREARRAELIQYGDDPTSPMDQADAVAINNLPSPTTSTPVAGNASFSSPFMSTTGNASFAVMSPTEAGSFAPPQHLTQKQQENKLIRVGDLERGLAMFDDKDSMITAQEVSSRCAALILINAVVKRKRERLAKKAMKNRAKRLLQELATGESTGAHDRDGEFGYDDDEFGSGGRRKKRDSRRKRDTRRKTSMHRSKFEQDSDDSWERVGGSEDDEDDTSHSGDSDEDRRGQSHRRGERIGEEDVEDDGDEEWVRVRRKKVEKMVKKGPPSTVETSQVGGSVVRWGSSPSQSPQLNDKSHGSPLVSPVRFERTPEVNRGASLPNESSSSPPLVSVSAFSRGSALVPPRQPTPPTHSSASSHGQTPTPTDHQVQAKADQEQVVESTNRRALLGGTPARSGAASSPSRPALKMTAVFTANPKIVELVNEMKQGTANPLATSEWQRRLYFKNLDAIQFDSWVKECQSLTSQLTQFAQLRRPPKEMPHIADNAIPVLLRILTFACNYTVQGLASISSAMVAHEHLSAPPPGARAGVLPPTRHPTLDRSRDPTLLSETVALLPRENSIVSVANLHLMQGVMQQDHRVAGERMVEVDRRVAHIQSEMAKQNSAEEERHRRRAEVSEMQEARTSAAELIDGSLKAFIAVTTEHTNDMLADLRSSACDSLLVWDFTVSSAMPKKLRSADNAHGDSVPKTQLAEFVTAQATLGRWVATRRMISLIDDIKALWPRFGATVPLIPVMGMLTRDDDQELVKLRAQAAELRGLLLEIVQMRATTDETNAINSALSAIVAPLITRYAGTSEAIRTMEARILRTKGAANDYETAEGLRSLHRRIEKGYDAAFDDVVDQASDATKKISAALKTVTTVVLDEEQAPVIKLFAFFTKLGKAIPEGSEMSAGGKSLQSPTRRQSAVSGSASIEHNEDVKQVIASLERNLLIGVFSLQQYRDALAKDESQLRSQLRRELVTLVGLPSMHVSAISAIATHAHAALTTAAASTLPDVSLPSAVGPEELGARYTAAVAQRTQQVAVLQRSRGLLDRIEREVETLSELALPKNSLLPDAFADLVWQQSRDALIGGKRHEASLFVVARCLNAANSASRAALDMLSAGRDQRMTGNHDSSQDVDSEVSTTIATTATRAIKTAQEHQHSILKLLERGVEWQTAAAKGATQELTAALSSGDFRPSSPISVGSHPAPQDPPQPIHQRPLLTPPRRVFDDI